MFVYPVPLLVILLVTSQFIKAHPSAISKGTNNNHPMHQRLKRDIAYLQHHELANNYNDDMPSGFDESSPFIYSLMQRRNRKRLIDF
ncbi:unnamed protein product [Rotaria socialis]|uniref:Uncharacterized protein n=1 Tax=Rotaria socialis TaxID=392032 RepID=A0A820JVS7_9BILA|nr:unnamed protein product [Rotaria socialis]CAF3268565.1 unnamed protein product [Rotaria socialis]CAF3367897.1 unnamed protein product [Rotaria socialis]CAF3390155.1 unnamed protein product [Rotaria socialis]CAF4332594.1 unnamed protein product [Rotaria socialis]